MIYYIDIISIYHINITLVYYISIVYWHYIILFYFISCHIILYYTIVLYFMFILYQFILYHIMSYYIMLYIYIILLYHAISFFISLYIIFCFIILYLIVSYYITFPQLHYQGYHLQGKSGLWDLEGVEGFDFVGVKHRARINHTRFDWDDCLGLGVEVLFCCYFHVFFGASGAKNTRKLA